MTKKPNKKVRITLELTTQFVTLLRACCTLRGIAAVASGESSAQLDPVSIVALKVLGEAMGQTALCQLVATPIEWRDGCIEALHSERRVYEDDKQVSGPVLAPQALKGSYAREHDS